MGFCKKGWKVSKSSAATQAELEKLNKTANEIIEKWPYLNLAVAGQLNEEELLLTAGSGKVK